MARVHKLIAVLLLCSVVVIVLQNRSLILSRYKSANIKDADNAKQRHAERQTATSESRHRTRNVSALRREGPVWPRTAQARPLTCQNCFHFDFPILLENSSICRTGSGFESVDVIMMIFTTHRETLRREAIRQTWASVTRQNTANTRHFFILGRSNSTKQMRKTEDEHARHGDLLMLDFVDSYANLTFKTMSGLRWIINRCGQARWDFNVSVREGCTVFTLCWIVNWCGQARWDFNVSVREGCTVFTLCWIVNWCGQARWDFNVSVREGCTVFTLCWIVNWCGQARWDFNVSVREGCTVFTLCWIVNWCGQTRWDFNVSVRECSPCAGSSTGVARPGEISMFPFVRNVLCSPWAGSSTTVVRPGEMTQSFAPTALNALLSVLDLIYWKIRRIGIQSDWEH